MGRAFRGIHVANGKLTDFRRAVASATMRVSP
jgi:hypothetical protein